MTEVAIKRVNFFDGQFLKQGEFLDLELYHRHMRRRMLYMLFDRSGIVQLGANDLAIEAVSVPNKEIRVRAGTAIGKRDDQLEAKEIVLREDRILDLDASTLVAGDIGIVTIHYDEQAVEPSSEGGVTGNTRIAEGAVLTVHRNTLPATNAPNGEPFVRLGNVAFNNLATTTPRELAFLKPSLLAPTATINLGPNQVTAGLTASLALSSVGLSLAALTAGDVQITPATGLTHTVTNQAPNSATLTVTATSAAPAVPRTVKVTVGGVEATTTLTVNAGLTVTGAGTVNQPADTVWEVTGSGFTDPATVQFTTSTGAASVTVTGGNVTPTELRIPLTTLNTDAFDNVIPGPVTVTCGSSSATSPSVTPPARIKSHAASIARGTLLTVAGRRFVAPVTVSVAGAAIAGFPRGVFLETRTNEELKISISSSLAAATYTIRIGTAGGTVETTVSVTL